VRRSSSSAVGPRSKSRETAFGCSRSRALFEIIGEAAAQTTDEVRARHPEIPWSRIVGMRNEIIHGYSTIDLAIVLKTVENRLPLLIRQLEAALR
jgi:uncharacterized protein with HEPN domain